MKISYLFENYKEMKRTNSRMNDNVSMTLTLTTIVPYGKLLTNSCTSSRVLACSCFVFLPPLAPWNGVASSISGMSRYRFLNCCVRSRGGGEASFSNGGGYLSMSASIPLLWLLQFRDRSLMPTATSRGCCSVMPRNKNIILLSDHMEGYSM